MNDRMRLQSTVVVALPLVVATVVAVALSPVAVNAARSIVSIKDADSRAKAQVDKGRLRVGNGQASDDRDENDRDGDDEDGRSGPDRRTS